VFSVGSVLKVCNEDPRPGELVEIRVQLRGYSPDRKELRAGSRRISTVDVRYQETGNVCSEFFSRHQESYFLQTSSWNTKNTLTCMSDYRRGFGLDIGFIDHYTHDSELQAITPPPLISTLYKSLAHTLSFPACYVFTSRSLVTASNSGDYWASSLKSSLNGGSFPTDYFLHRLA
jgi:hypothetical protein